MIYRGTKFYLVGTVTPPEDDDSGEDFRKRVFTRDYTTVIPMKVESLAKAYNVMPDLLAARLEIGIQLTPEWALSTPANIILH